MTLDEAVKLVKDQYGLLDSYVNASGHMMYVVKAQKELSAIPVAKMPECGIALFGPEVIDLARGAVTIESLVRKKNPELFL
jgi:tmRNA-binding protein